MKRVLAREDPQLVILNGDLISGEATDRRKSSAYLDSVVEPLSDLDIPWASTYGNHDSRQTLDPREIFEQEKKYSNSLTSRMVSAFEAGVTNYYLPVFSHGSSSSKESTSTPALILWFFDSRGGHIPRQKTGIIDPIHRPNWVDDSVVDWFIEANTNLTSQYGRSIPSLAFVHIPVVAMRAYQEKKGVNPSTEPGINGERVQQQGFNGGFEYEGQDLGFLGTLLNTEGLMAMFSGHDHDNDW